MGTFSATTDQKMVAALHMLPQIGRAKSKVPALRMAESTLLENKMRFTAAIVKGLRSEYLRLPSTEEIAPMEKEYSEMRF